MGRLLLRNIAVVWMFSGGDRETHWSPFLRPISRESLQGWACAPPPALSRGHEPRIAQLGPRSVADLSAGFE
jgi:hypothetical protein